MIINRKPYPAMKNSGVPWLGIVPDHWAIDRLKTVFVEIDRRSGTGLEPLLSLRIERGLVDHHEMGGNPISPSELTHYKLTRPGELVMNRMRAASGLFAVTKTVGLVSPDYAVLRPKREACLEYFGYQFRTPQLMSIFRLESRGLGTGESGFLRLYFNRFGMIEAVVPPTDEQGAIVRFLDHADRRIRRYIRAKQKLIKLLEEQKQAIIHRAVTRGLDPNVRLKPSGVEWLGDVPEHWEVVRAGTVCRFLSAKAHEQFVEPDGEHICVTARFVSTGGRSFRRCTRNFSPAQLGDVLMVMSDLPRGRALARAYIVDDDRSYAVNQRVCILRPARVHPPFLAFVANRHPELLAHDDGFNQTHLPNAAFKIMRLPLPPLHEQVAIAGFLTREDVAITGAALRSEREIALLREYRTRLIADVVTGKLDVREAAARLPDEVNEPEPLDEIETESKPDEADTDDAEVAEEAEA